eukprot:UN27773
MESKENAYSEISKGLEKPLPFYPQFDSLLKITCPREQLCETKDLENWSDEKLLKYQKAVRFWKQMWFLQRFRHYQAECRMAEIPGQREEQTFWRAPPLAMPVRANVLTFDWKKFGDSHKEVSGKLFDIIATDPPWTLATEKSTRGVALNYDQITDALLLKAVPWFDLMAENGVLLMWVINAKMTYALNFLADRGFKVLENMTWLKMSQKRLFARGHGYYLQHAKEECIVVTKGNVEDFNWEAFLLNFAAEKRCQSQNLPSFMTCVKL